MCPSLSFPKLIYCGVREPKRIKLFINVVTSETRVETRFSKCTKQSTLGVVLRYSDLIMIEVKWVLLWFGVSPIVWTGLSRSVTISTLCLGPSDRGVGTRVGDEVRRLRFVHTYD